MLSNEPKITLHVAPYVPPKGGIKRHFAVFTSKIQLLSKEVCYKVPVV